MPYHMISRNLFIFRYHEHEEQLELWWCYMYKYSMDAIPPVFHNIAMWLTVLLAGQRYVTCVGSIFGNKPSENP